MKILLCLAMKSCGPLSASTAAHCDDRRRVRRRLRLHHRHRLDQRLRPAGIADAPAGHAIGLRAAVDGERARIKRRLDLRRRRELEVVVDQVLVHVVGHHVHMRMPHQHVGERLQFGARIGGARRIRRRVQQHPFGLRRDRAIELLRRQLEAGRHRGLDRHRLAAGEQHHVEIAHPIGRGEDHLVARIERRNEGVVQHLLAAGADGDLRRLVVEAVLALELLDDRRPSARRCRRRWCTWTPCRRGSP